jgi:RNA polymerase sigma-70 factor (ECF subfamily)
MNSTILTDTELVGLARGGDGEAFGALFERHRKKCIAVGLYYLKNNSDAEDQVQSAFLKVYERLDQFHGDSEFSTWLARIVVNECLMLMRRRRRVNSVDLDRAPSEWTPKPIQLTAPGPDPEGEWAYRQMTGELRLAVRRLPRLMRDVMLLRHIHGLPLRDVAGRLGISVPAAKSRLIRARVELQSRMVSHCGVAGSTSILDRTAAPIQKLGRRCASRQAS